MALLVPPCSSAGLLRREAGPSAQQIVEDHFKDHGQFCPQQAEGAVPDLDAYTLREAVQGRWPGCLGG